MDVASFAEIDKDFSERVGRMRWRSVTAIDRQVRPDSQREQVRTEATGPRS